MDINELWNEMAKLEGYTFETLSRGKSFTIKRRNDNYFDVYREGKKLRPIKKQDMELILNNPNESVSFFTNDMQCASYAVSVYNTIVNKG